MPASESLLVGISGIDASGKGYITAKLAAALEQRGLRCAVIHADGWLNLPQVRFGGEDKALRFYENAFRFDEMFSRLISHLKAARSIDLIADQIDETATACHEHRFKFEDVDVVLLEGIFLFTRQLRRLYDLTVWIDCSFETALQRRGTESGAPFAERDGRGLRNDLLSGTTDPHCYRRPSPVRRCHLSKLLKADFQTQAFGPKQKSVAAIGPRRELFQEDRRRMD
jgi:uridine kinase